LDERKENTTMANSKPADKSPKAPAPKTAKKPKGKK